MIVRASLVFGCERSRSVNLSSRQGILSENNYQTISLTKPLYYRQMTCVHDTLKVEIVVILESFLMSDAAVKETRRILRQVQQHLTQARLNLGVISESVGLVDVLHHPDNTLSELNYVTPRKNTAWISARDVEQGLSVLSDHDRLNRVEYIEGLFPPLFAKSLHDLGLRVERETPLMAYVHDAENPLIASPLPEGVKIETVTTQEGCALWWYVWRNAHYDVVTHTAEPIYIGFNMMHIALGQQIDFVLYRHRFPVGVARVTLNAENQTAHLTALALMREARTPELLRVLQIAAVQAAIGRGCPLVFTSGETENDRKLNRETGFVDYGSVVCYAATTNETKVAHKDVFDEPMVQPILTLRSS